MVDTRALMACLAVAFAPLACPAVVQAAPSIAGTFSGTLTIHQTVVVNGQLGSSTSNVTASGTFGASLGACSFGTSAAQGFCVFSPTSVGSSSDNYITLDIAGLSLAYQFSLAGISVANTPAGQRLTLSPTEGEPYYNADITLSGPANAFVDGLDLATLHAGPVDPAQSGLSFMDGRDLVGSGPLSNVAFTSVPEPPGWPLLFPAAALAALSVRGRKRPE